MFDVPHAAPFTRSCYCTKRSCHVMNLLSNGAVLVPVNLRHLLQTDRRGGPSPHEQQMPLKKTDVSVSLLQEADVTGLRPLQPEQETTVETPVGACVLPALDWEVTCALIAESTDYVIVGHRRTTNSCSLVACLHSNALSVSLGRFE